MNYNAFSTPTASGSSRFGANKTSTKSKPQDDNSELVSRHSSTTSLLTKKPLGTNLPSSSSTPSTARSSSSSFFGSFNRIRPSLTALLRRPRGHEEPVYLLLTKFTITRLTFHEFIDNILHNQDRIQVCIQWRLLHDQHSAPSGGLVFEARSKDQAQELMRKVRERLSSAKLKYKGGVGKEGDVMGELRRWKYSEGVGERGRFLEELVKGEGGRVWVSVGTEELEGVKAVGGEWGRVAGVGGWLL